MSDGVSVIVPIYNVGKYLRNCIDSIRKQTYTNIEIILVDDGSTDESGAICDEIASIDGRVTVYHNENHGVSASRNFGMQKATRKYISFVDSDDTISEDYIYTLYKNMIEFDADMAITSYQYVLEDGSLLPKSQEANEKEIEVLEGEVPLIECLLQRKITNFVCKMYKREVLTTYKENVVYEDIVFTIKVVKKCKKVVVINKPLYFYLKRDGSETRTYNEKRLLDFCDAIDERYSIIKEENEFYQKYNIYAMLKSFIALCTIYVIHNLEYPEVMARIDNFSSIILNADETELKTLTNLFEENCLELLHDKESFFDYLKKSYYEKKGR